MNSTSNWRPILWKEFHHDGRGPELKRAHFGPRGSNLIATDFANPEAEGQDQSHLIFRNPQAFCFTPEEEFAFESNEIFVDKNKASIWIIENSPWISSFSNRHSSRGKHFKIMFYDEFLDIVCDEIISKPGGFNQEYEIIDTFWVDQEMKDRNGIINFDPGVYAVIGSPYSEPRIPRLQEQAKLIDKTGIIREVMIRGIYRNAMDVPTVWLNEGEIIEKGSKLLL